MEFGSKSLMLFFLSLLLIQSFLTTKSHSQSIVKRLPGYPGDLPFKLETGYIGVGENEEVQLFYYFVESTRNANKDPVMFYVAGGPGASGLLSLICEIGPLVFNLDNGGLDNVTLALNPNAWTQMANIIFMDPAPGIGFSYAESKEGWKTGDTIIATQAHEFIRKFLINHPKFLKNPLYIGGISYMGIVVPKLSLNIYEGNERGDQPLLNIQGYTLISPLSHKFNDFNSRFEYAHNMALISHDTYKSGVENCQGNYIDTNVKNSICAKSLQSYAECTSRINFNNILQPFCDESDPTEDCELIFIKAIKIWANLEDVQEALNIRQGKIGVWEVYNDPMHYEQGKNDKFYYSYDIFDTFPHHKMLSNRSCQALIISGDRDITIPYISTQQWIDALNLRVEVPWKPFFVDGQTGGYETKYAGNDYSLTFASVKDAGHVVPSFKPKESFILAQRWFSTKTSQRIMSHGPETGKAHVEFKVHNIQERPKRIWTILAHYLD